MQCKLVHSYHPHSQFKTIDKMGPVGDGETSNNGQLRLSMAPLHQWSGSVKTGPPIHNVREQLYISLSRIPHIFSCGANHFNTKWEYFPRILHNFPRQHDPSTSHIRTQLHYFSRCKQGTRALHLQMLFWMEVCMEMRISRSDCLEILNAELG